MFSNPSKKVPTGGFELTVRFLVPSSVIFEALTSMQVTQVNHLSPSLLFSIIHNRNVRLNPEREVIMFFIMVVSKVNSSLQYYF